MSGLVVNYGGCEYWDRKGSFRDGSIRPSRIDLNHIVVTLYDLFAEEGFTVSTIDEAA